MSKRLKLLLATSLIFSWSVVTGSYSNAAMLNVRADDSSYSSAPSHIDTNQWTHSSNAQLSIYYADSKTLAQSYNKMVDPSVQIIKDHGRLVAKINIAKHGLWKQLQVEDQGQMRLLNIHTTPSQPTKDYVLLPLNKQQPHYKVNVTTIENGQEKQQQLLFNITPSTAQEDGHQVNKQAVNFYVRKKEENKLSHMDDYVKHPGHYVTIQGKRYFEMTLTHIDWWQSYQFYHQNTKLQHEVIYENSDTQEATVRIPVEEDTKEIEARIHIVIPELNYDHHYTTYIVLGVKHPNETDDSQSDTSAEKRNKDKHQQDPGDKSVPPASEKQQAHVKQQQQTQQNNDTHASNNQDTSSRTTTPSNNSETTTQSSSSTPTPSSHESSAQQGEKKQVTTAASKNKAHAAQQHKDKNKRTPAFDRNADKSYHTDGNKQPNVNLPKHTKDYIIFGILIFISVAGLIATYFINRKR